MCRSMWELNLYFIIKTQALRIQCVSSKWPSFQTCTLFWPIFFSVFQVPGGGGAPILNVVEVAVQSWAQFIPQAPHNPSQPAIPACPEHSRDCSKNENKLHMGQFARNTFSCPHFFGNDSTSTNFGTCLGVVVLFRQKNQTVSPKMISYIKHGPFCVRVATKKCFTHFAQHCFSKNCTPHKGCHFGETHCTLANIWSVSLAFLN